MPQWFLISIVIINGLSFFAWWFFDREVRYLIESHTHILGEENEELINTLCIKILRILYLIAVLAIMIVCWFILP